MDIRLAKFLVILGMSALLACSQNSGELSGSFNIGSASKKKQPRARQAEVVKADNGKASDDDEGIPGYMASVDNIETTIEQDKFIISAPEATVSKMIDRNIYATAWSIGSDAIDEENQVIYPGQSSLATFIGGALIAENGSFYFVLSEPSEDQRIVINISSDPTPDSLYFTVDDPSTYAGLFLYKKNEVKSNQPNRRDQNNFQHNDGKNHNSGEKPSVSLEVVGLKASDPNLLD